MILYFQKVFGMERVACFKVADKGDVLACSVLYFSKHFQGCPIFRPNFHESAPDDNSINQRLGLFTVLFQI